MVPGRYTQADLLARSRWEGGVDQRLASHDSQFATIGTELRDLKDEVHKQGESIGKLHLTADATKIATDVIRTHVERVDNNKWNVRSTAIGISLAFAGFASVFVAIFAAIHG